MNMHLGVTMTSDDAELLVYSVSSQAPLYLRT